MDENIPQIVVDSAVPPVIYSSAGGAIAGLLQNPRVARAEADNARHRGATVLGVYCALRRVGFRLSDGSVLEIALDEKLYPEWRFADGDSVSPPPADAGPERAALHWQRIGRPMLWERRELLNARVGKRVSGVSPSDTDFHCYFNDGVVLACSALRNVETNEVFMFWGPGD